MAAPGTETTGRVVAFDLLVDKRPVSVATTGLERKRPAEIIPLVGFKGWTPPGSDATDEDIEF